MDELYVIARQVLLDVLAALCDHRDATILVGAQAKRSTVVAGGSASRRGVPCHAKAGRTGRWHRPNTVETPTAGQ